MDIIKSKSKRNGNVELLRFVFAIGIILLHCSDNFFKFPGGYLGVEFFFMICGVYLISTMNSEYMSSQSLIKSIKHASISLAKKVLPFYPYVVLSSFIAMLVIVYIRGDFVTHFILTLFDLLYTQCLTNAIPYLSATGVIWYLSSMYVALFFIYISLYYNKKIAIRYVFPVIIIAFSSIMLINFKNFGVHSQFVKVGFISLNSGLMRAFISICTGVIIGELSSVIRKKDICRYKHVFAVLEILLYATVFVYMKFYAGSCLDIIIIVFIGFAVLITTSNISWFDGKFNNKYIYFLGKYSSVLFLNHFNLVHFQKEILLKAGINEYNEAFAKICFIVISFLTALFVMYFVKHSLILIKKLNPKNKN